MGTRETGKACGSHAIRDLVDRAVESGLVDGVAADGSAGNWMFNLDDLVQLCSVDPLSKDAFYMAWGARELLTRGNGGRGEVFFQIGLDAHECPGGCSFCSFAPGSDAQYDDFEMSQAQAVEYCKTLDAAGIHMISLMTTCSYDKEKYLELVRAVREAVSPDLPLMANVTDFGPEYAARLKQAGIDAVYHAPRLGEGEITAIPLERRFDTLDASIEADLTVCSGIEPLRPGIPPRQIAERIAHVAAYDPLLLGACSLVPVPGTVWEGTRRTTRVERQVFNYALVLYMGGRLPYNNANTIWVDAGTRPRGVKLVDASHLALDFEDKKALLEDEGWEVVPGERNPRWFAGNELARVREHAGGDAARTPAQVGGAHAR